MTDVGTLGNLAWRDWNTDGVPSSGERKPPKADIRAFVEAVETQKTTVLANVAALRLYEGDATSAILKVRTSFGDRGGGVFTVKSGDSSTTDDGSMIVVDARGRRWWRSVTDDVLYPEWFGALRNGTADDKPAWAAAVAYGAALGSARVRGMAGSYRWASGLVVTNGNVRLEGASGKNSTIIVGDFNGDIISIGDGSAAPNFCSVMNLRIDGSEDRTSGAGVRVRNGHDVEIGENHFGLYHDTCVQLDGGAAQFICKVFDNELSAGAIGIDVGSVGGVVQDCHIFRNTIFNMTAAGIRLVHSSGAYAGFNSIGNCRHGILWAPGDGQYVAAAKFVATLGDTSRSHGWVLKPTHANGSISSCTIDACWAASNGVDDNGHGMVIDPNGGTISGLSITTLSAENNRGHGILHMGGTEIQFNNPQVFCNSQAGSGLFHGLAVAANVGRFKVDGGWYGKGGRIAVVPPGTNNQGYGLIVNAGSGNHYTITNVTALDNVLGDISDGGTGPIKIVKDNIGYTEGRAVVADSAYTVKSTDRIVAYTSLSAARTVALPAASNYPVGKRLVIIDESGSASPSNTISIDPDGTDTVDGSNTTQVLINVPRGRCELESNGSNGWGLLACSVEYTNSLSVDVAMNDDTIYHTGPSVAQGPAGRWGATGNVTVKDTTAGGIFFIKLWDGTTAVDSAVIYGIATDYPMHAAQSGVLSAPAGNIRISVRDTSSDNGVIVANATAVTKDSTITVRRIP